MNFETIAIVVFALAALVFLFARRRVIRDLKADIEIAREQLEKLRAVCLRQRLEIDNLIQSHETERRARQMATLAAIGNKTPPPRPIKRRDDPRPGTASSKDSQVLANTWTDPGTPYLAPIAPSPAPAPAYEGAGGTFDGGGASGDYDRPDTSSACSPSSDSSASNYDSGSSSSSDSGCSSSFND